MGMTYAWAFLAGAQAGLLSDRLYLGLRWWPSALGMLAAIGMAMLERVMARRRGEG